MEAQRLDLLVEAISDYAIYMLDRDGRVSTWNSGAEKIKGYRAQDIIGQHFSTFFSAEDRAQGLPEKILHTARVTGRHEAEGWRIRRDGTRFWANGILQAVRDETGT